MDVVTISTVVGGLAAAGTLAWAMLGNPNLREKLHLRSNQIALAGKEQPRKVTAVDWRSLDHAISKFVDSNHRQYDLVVGLHPDGVSSANSIAGLLGARFATIEKRYPGLVRKPFFIFDDSTQTRSRRESTAEFTPPSDLPDQPRILVVDGVTTFGNALVRAEMEILSRLPECCQVDFFVYAVDLARLSSAHPELVPRTRFQIKIDNHQTWLRFPWDAK